jgi:hypothetical protein
MRAHLEFVVNILFGLAITAILCMGLFELLAGLEAF